MRQITLDTETTGLEVANGHRIIEIGCVEMLDRRLTGRNLHLYLNPDRDIDEDATRVHGITLDRLVDKPRFADVADRIIEFCRGAEIIIHNAAFDVGFLDAEFERAGHGLFAEVAGGVTDTLALAREMFPGKRNNLDALCERLMVPNAHRTVHGALLDSTLLAEVYLAMTRGQGSFEIGLDGAAEDQAGVDGDTGWPPTGLVVVHATAAERKGHAALLVELAKQSGTASRWLVGGAD